MPFQVPDEIVPERFEAERLVRFAPETAGSSPEELSWTILLADVPVSTARVTSPEVPPPVNHVEAVIEVISPRVRNVEPSSESCHKDVVPL